MEVLCAQRGFEDEEVEVDLWRGGGEVGYVGGCRGLLLILQGRERSRWRDGRGGGWGAFDELIEARFGGHTAP